MIVGALVGASCGLIGAFLVLRRLALLGDAISHSVLLGIVVVFWLTHSRCSPADDDRCRGGRPADGGVGRVDPADRAGQGRRRDRSGVPVPLRARRVHDFPIPEHRPHRCRCSALWRDRLHAALSPRYVRTSISARRRSGRWARCWRSTSLFVVLLYKELKLTTFDAGIRGRNRHLPRGDALPLMAAVSATTVVAFDAVGAMLVVAMLIVPAATAQLLTRRLASPAGAVDGHRRWLPPIGGYWLARCDQRIDRRRRSPPSLGSGSVLAWLLLAIPGTGRKPAPAASPTAGIPARAGGRSHRRPSRMACPRHPGSGFRLGHAAPPSRAVRDALSAGRA